jgi:predicted ATP-dependent endonuclease of OLD family
MYIYKIIIQNFRNLQNFTWKPDENINVLFGHNGCGKTNIAEALSYLFTPNRFRTYFERSDYYLGCPSNKIIIQAWLADIASFDAELSLKIQHIDNNDKFVADDCEQETRQVLILQLESAADDKMEWSFVLSTGLQLCSIKDRAAINYNYIDTARNPVREVGLQEKSVFYQLAKDTIGDELEAISKDVVSYANRKLAESSVLTKYLESIKEMGKLDVIEKYKLLLKNPESSWNNSGYELGTLAGDAELSFDKQSSGIQNLFLLLLMKKKLEGAGIVFIEELEQSLEPKNQRYIAEEYRKLNVGQLFITSHSVDIISRFDYKNIFVVLPTEAKRLFEGQSESFMKEVTRTNRKDFISSLMANNILLVEGESELGSFPIYSFVNGLSFSYLDIEILRVGGKGHFKTYVDAYKKLGKNVFAFLDNDSDVAKTVQSIKDSADKIILANNDYEEMIFPYISQYAKDLSSLVDFQNIKNKLCSILAKDEEKCSGHEKRIRPYLVGHEVELASLSDYKDLIKYPRWFCYMLHDSFATTYYATAIANMIAEKTGAPLFFVDLVNCIKGLTENLELQNGETNVWKIKRR